MSQILLTSNGLGGDDVYELVGRKKVELDCTSVVIIPDAEISGVNSPYVLLAKEQLGALGLEAAIMSLRDPDFGSVTESADMVYISGGNTFDLIDAVTRTIGVERLRGLLYERKFVIGVSAGSLLLTPTIRIAGEIEPDSNDAGLTDLGALSMVPAEYYPHYSEAVESEIAAYESRYDVRVIRNTDGAYTLFES